MHPTISDKAFRSMVNGVTRVLLVKQDELIDEVNNLLLPKIDKLKEIYFDNLMVQNHFTALRAALDSGSLDEKDYERHLQEVFGKIKIEEADKLIEEMQLLVFPYKPSKNFAFNLKTVGIKVECPYDNNVYRYVNIRIRFPHVDTPYQVTDFLLRENDLKVRLQDLSGLAEDFMNQFDSLVPRN